MRAALVEAKGKAEPDERSILNQRDLAVLRQALSGALPLAIASHRESDIRQAIRLAADYGLRVVIVGGAEAWRAADALAAAHIPVVLDPDAKLPYTFDQFGSRQTNAPLLVKTGVTIAFGQVGGALEENYNAGLALREGRYRCRQRAALHRGVEGGGGQSYGDLAARVLAGVIAPGQDADLMVLDGDPLDPATNAAAVPLATRQDVLARRYRSAR